MEISKALQEDILCVQNKLKNAIRDHQICVIKLKDDPNNTDILDRIREIQLHIVSLGRWQKQVVQRLRKEVESSKAENSLNGTKISVASLLGINNNNHITTNNERRLNVARTNGNSINGHAESRASSKEDYEEIVRNGDVESPIRDNNCAKGSRSSSVDPGSVDDEVVEVPMEVASPVASIILEPDVEEKLKSPVMEREQQCFLGCLGLITSARLLELQNKRAERKRRSTANSHFIYSNWEVPMKRKRHAYLQSLGSAPQTRQTTARLNGPSPPPASTTKSNSSTNNKTSSSRATTKSLIHPAKSLPAPVPKPNILRNGDGKQQQQQQKEFYPKTIKQETDKTSSTARTEGKITTQATSTGKTVHIPGLPSSLTIERIENDSTVCITCRNPGTLTVCEYCAAKFHVSCHTISPASSCYCPKCASRFRSKGLSSADMELLRLEIKSIKKEKETVAAAYAPRAFGKAGEDAEVHKASGGLYKADAAQASRQLLTAAALGINQLPSSTFLIPIATPAEGDDVTTVTAVDESHGLSSSSSALGSSTVPAAATASKLGYGIAEQQQQQQQQSQQQSSILLNQLSQPNITAASGEPRILRKAQEILNGQSFLILGKVAGQPVAQRRWSADRISSKPKQAVSVLEWSGRSASNSGAQQQSGHAIAKSKNYVTVEVICNDDDKTELASENSTDCVYISENSSGAPDLVDLGSPRVEPVQQQEPEVLNVSSGSSVQPVDSPHATVDTTAEQLDTSDSSTNESIARRSIDNWSEQLEQQQQEPENTNDLDDNIDNDSCIRNDFLRSIFPGRYGFKIDIVDLESSGSSSADNQSSPNSPSERRVDSQPAEHVKLEEAHLPAPPRAELITTNASEDDTDKVEDDNESVKEEENSSSPSEQLTTVPDNKSDDVAMRDDSQRSDVGQEDLLNGDNSSSGCLTSLDEPQATD